MADYAANPFAPAAPVVTEAGYGPNLLSNPQELGAPSVIYGLAGGRNFAAAVYAAPSPLLGSVWAGGYYAAAVSQAPINVLNMVWDSVAGGFVTWLSAGADPQGTKYPAGAGYGSYGIHTSLYSCLGADRRNTWGG
jgi:hypothetical protein